MYVVGSDQFAVVDLRAVPDGHHHAVDADGRVLCRAGRARFTWPALAWHAVDADAWCPLCAQVQRAQQAFASAPAYPDQPKHAEAPLVGQQPHQEPVWW
jgi:hypothetical protein